MVLRALSGRDFGEGLRDDQAAVLVHGFQSDDSDAFPTAMRLEFKDILSYACVIFLAYAAVVSLAFLFLEQLFWSA